MPYDLLSTAWSWHLEMRSDNTDLRLYRANPSGQYPLNRAVVRFTLAEYATGANTSVHFAEKTVPVDGRCWGLEAYAALADSPEHSLAGERRFDTRGPHLLWEHKRLMGRRVRATLPGPEAEALGAQATALEATTANLRLAATAAWSHGRTEYLRRPGPAARPAGRRCPVHRALSRGAGRRGDHED